MPGKRRFILNGVAVSLETPSPVAGSDNENGIKREKYMQVGYSQALERWGGSVTAAIWRGLNERNTTARVSLEQFEILRRKPSVNEAAATIAQIIERSQS